MLVIRGISAYPYCGCSPVRKHIVYQWVGLHGGVPLRQEFGRRWRTRTQNKRFLRSEFPTKNSTHITPMALELGVDVSKLSLDGSFDLRVYLAGAKDVYPHINQIASGQAALVQGTPDDFLASKGDEVQKYRYQMKNKVCVMTFLVQLRFCLGICRCTKTLSFCFRGLVSVSCSQKLRFVEFCLFVLEIAFWATQH